MSVSSTTSTPTTTTPTTTTPSTTSTSASGPAITFTGLGSGLDTDSIITALMNIEKQPQVLLQQQQTADQAQDTALNTVITKLNAVATAARNIGNPIDWEAVTATASDPTRVTLAASSGSSTGSVSFTVLSLASPDSVASFGQVPDVDTTSIAPGMITIGTSGGSTTVNTGGGTLNEIVQAINSQTTIGLTAAAVQVSPGQYKLQLSATNVNETVNTDISQFPGLGPVWGQVTTPSQAKIHVGGAAMGFDVTSNSNTFADLLPGVNVTVNQADPATTVTVTSTSDTDSLATKVQAVVDAYNAAIDEMQNDTAYDTTTKVAQPLQGMSAISQTRESLSDAIMGSITTTPSLVGIQTTSDGHISFDKDTFVAEFQSNPSQAIALFANPLDPANPGLADRLKSTLLSITEVGTGSLWSAQQGVETTIADLGTQITAYQVQLDAKETALRAQFAALEGLLTTLHAESASLTSSINASAGQSSDTSS
jgi:flagellar hook-associated protein 2